MKTTGKSAFTLLEMLVVIGIIGVLMGVIISQFGGATESAKAAKCETNMKNLATAAHTYALSQSDGYFPTAGSYSHGYSNHKKHRKEYNNWSRISWIGGSERRPDRITTQPVKLQPVSFNDDDSQVHRFRAWDEPRDKRVGQHDRHIHGVVWRNCGFHERERVPERNCEH